MKGDYVEVLVAAGERAHAVRIVATKGGRTVRVKYGAKWLDVEEVSRPTSANPKGRAVGNKLRIRVDSLISIEERREEELVSERPARHPATDQEVLPLG